MSFWSSLALVLLFVEPPASGQAAPGDSQTLQALLTEIRELRRDLHNVTVTSQRVQIALYRLQVLDAAVTRASQRYNEAHLKLADAERARKQLTANLQELEGQRTPNDDPNHRKVIDARLAEIKRSLEIWASDEQQRQVTESESLSQLRAEQAKLSELQSWLDKLDKMLETGR